MVNNSNCSLEIHIYYIGGISGQLRLAIGHSRTWEANFGMSYSMTLNI